MGNYIFSVLLIKYILFGNLSICEILGYKLVPINICYIIHLTNFYQKKNKKSFILQSFEPSFPFRLDFMTIEFDVFEVYSVLAHSQAEATLLIWLLLQRFTTYRHVTTHNKRTHTHTCAQLNPNKSTSTSGVLSDKSGPEFETSNYMVDLTERPTGRSDARTGIDLLLPQPWGKKVSTQREVGLPLRHRHTGVQMEQFLQLWKSWVMMFFSIRRGSSLWRQISII